MRRRLRALWARVDAWWTLVALVLEEAERARVAERRDWHGGPGPG